MKETNNLPLDKDFIVTALKTKVANIDSVYSILDKYSLQI